MMTKPDLTNTAPKRIYLDIGDQFALERVASGDLRWDLLDGVTWSEDNATSHGIPYVRADLVPTPAASGAAPADRLKAAIDAIAPRFESANPIPVQKTTVPVEEWTELLAALNAVIVALASPQVAPEGVPAAWVHRDSRSAVPFVEDAAKVISWLPPEALWPEGVPSYIQVTPLYAAPVQVAPPNLNSPLAGDCRTVGGFLSDVMTAAGLVEHGRQCKPLAERISVACSDLRARIFQGSAPVAPQDDARDAAEVWNEAIEAAARRIEGGSFLHDQAPAKLFANQLAPVIRSMKRTPAAKPTEERS